MTIASSNQLHSIDETCLSDLSAENESTISGGTFGLLGLFFGGLFRYGQPNTGKSTGTTVIVNNYITNTNTNTNGSSSDSGSSSTTGGH